MNKITLFTKNDCGLCGGVLFVIQKVRRAIPFDLELVDITAPGQEAWLDAYENDIPVVHLNDQEIFRHRIDEASLRRLLKKCDAPALKGRNSHSPGQRSGAPDDEEPRSETTE